MNFERGTSTLEGGILIYDLAICLLKLHENEKDWIEREIVRPSALASANIWRWKGGGLKRAATEDDDANNNNS